MILEAIVYYLISFELRIYTTHRIGIIADITLFWRDEFEFSTMIADLILCLAEHLQCFEL